MLPEAVSRGHEVTLPAIPGRAPSSPSATVHRAHLDVIPPIIHGTSGEDGSLRLPQMAQIPYGGAECWLPIQMDKEVTKLLAAAASRWYRVLVRAAETRAGESATIERVLREIGPRPSSSQPASATWVRISKVRSQRGARPTASARQPLRHQVLVERRVDAEVEVAVLGDEEAADVGAAGCDPGRLLVQVRRDGRRGLVPARGRKAPRPPACGEACPPGPSGCSKERESRGRLLPGPGERRDPPERGGSVPGYRRSPSTRVSGSPPSPLPGAARPDRSSSPSSATSHRSGRRHTYPTGGRDGTTLSIRGSRSPR